MIMSSQTVALICWGLSLAELVARPDLFAILLSSESTTGLFQGGSSESFGYKESRLLAICVLVAATMCTGGYKYVEKLTVISYEVDKLPFLLIRLFFLFSFFR